MTSQQPLFSTDSTFSDADFLAISDFIAQEAGISLTASSKQLVYSRLASHVRRLGCHDFARYLRAVHADKSGDERQVLVHALTTNTTRFFREQEHFETLAREHLPELIDVAQKGGRVRLWSAGCSTGEEAYSLAAVVLAQFPQAAQFDFRILATDINRLVLERASHGTYGANQVSGVSAEYFDLMFEQEADPEKPRCIRAALKKLISFRYLNLIAPWPVQGPFDAIFCRNVAIYMDQPTQLRLWAGFEAVLAPKGMLFIGHSERLGPEISARFQPRGRTAFRRALQSGNIQKGESRVA